MSAPYYGDLALEPIAGEAHWVETPDDKRLRVVIWPGGDAGTVAIFPGRTEYAEKYTHVAKRAADLGFSSFAIDWRGQGLATRINGTTAVGHVDDFAEFQTDMAAVHAHPAVACLSGPRHLLCHSMGGCIGFRAITNGLAVKTATFVSPMWGIGLHPGLKALARCLGPVAALFGASGRHAPGQSGASYVLRANPEANVLTSDPDMLTWIQSHLTAHPELGLGGPSYGWLTAALRETRALAPLPQPDLPILTFLGGDEAIVDCAAIRTRMARPGGHRFVEIPKARHEILIEKPEMRDRIWQEIAAHWGVSPNPRSEPQALGGAA